MRILRRWRQEVSIITPVAVLPVLLTALFVFQSVAFDAWLAISPVIYGRMVVVSVSLGAALFGPAMFMRGRWRTAWLAAVSAVTSAVFVGEYLYYSYAAGFLQLTSLRLIGQADAFMGTALRSLSPRMLLFVAGPALVLWAALGKRHRWLSGWQTPSPLGVRRSLALAVAWIAVVGAGYGYLVHTERREYGDVTRLYKSMYDLEAAVGKMGIVNYVIEDAVKRAFFAERVSAADEEFVAQWQAGRASGVTDRDTRGKAVGRNLIFIQVESLENAVIGARVGEKVVTPHLNALAKEGLYFSRYYAPVGVGSTADAEFTVLNSLYYLPDSVAFVDKAHNQYAALPKLFAGAGYRTAVLHGDYPAFWNRSSIYPNLGYQTWFMEDAFKPTRHIGITGLGDADFFEQAMPMLKGLPQPFLATLITLSSHTPFIVPEDVRPINLAYTDWLNDEQERYLESVSYTDEAIGKFIARLKEEGLYERSVIVILGDHGSKTGIAAALKADGDDTKATADARVPLIILAPGLGLTGERTVPGSHLDLYPTLANLFGLKTPASALGQDLLSTKTPVAVIRRPSGAVGMAAAVAAELTYEAADDGVFEHGRCLKTESREAVEVGHCRRLYDEQNATLRVSDTVIRGNLVESLTSP
jgi:phosphoglycerol transferase MdoB-like AlkP superfamily enzyme